MENVLLSSKDRFHEFYIDLFHDLNLRFLNCDSMVACETFCKEQQKILSSPPNGYSKDVLAKKIVDVLQTCDFFLENQFSLFLVSRWQISFYMRWLCAMHLTPKGICMDFIPANNS